MTEKKILSGNHVVIVGGSFAGLGAAYAARNQLRPEDQVTLISSNDHFVFAPSLVWTALGKPLLNSSFHLETALLPRDIRFLRRTVTKVCVKEQVVSTDTEDISYDRLIVATGGRPHTQAVPGLAGEFRSASWVVGEDSALEARNMLRSFYENPGPIVIGVAEGAGYISAAYEIALGLDTKLRDRGIRNAAPITFVTAEPYLGHLGFGQTAARDELNTLFAKRNIEAITDVSVTHVQNESVRLSNGRSLMARAMIIMPPFTGSVNIWKSAGLTDDDGMLPITADYHHIDDPNVYAAGVAARFRDPIPPLDTRLMPQTGYLSLHMGKAAGQNAAASLGAGKPAGRRLPYVFDVRVLDGGADDILLTSRGRDSIRNTAILLPGMAGHALKVSIERYLLWRLRNGKMNLP